MMKRRLCQAAIVFVVLVQVGCCFAQEQSEEYFYLLKGVPDWVCGQWQISKVAGHSKVCVADEFARKSLGTPIFFKANLAHIYDADIKPAYYYRGKATEWTFFKGYTTLARLGMTGNFVDYILVSAAPRSSLEAARVYDGDAYLIIKDRSTLIVGGDGVWFEMVKCGE